MIARPPSRRRAAAPSDAAAPARRRRARGLLAAPRRVWLFIGALALASAGASGRSTPAASTPSFVASPRPSLVGARARVLPRRGLRRPPAVPQAGAHALADGDRAHLSACCSRARRRCCRAARRARSSRWSCNRAKPAPARQVRVQSRRAAALQRRRAARLPLARRRRRDRQPHSGCSSSLACAVAHVVGVLLVSAVIAVAEERLRRAAAPDGRSSISTVGALATASLGLASVELLDGSARSRSSCSSSPSLACGRRFRGYMEQREQREHVEFLYESMRATQGAPEFGLAVGQLLVAARRLLRAEYAEILLLPPSRRARPAAQRQRRGGRAADASRRSGSRRRTQPRSARGRRDRLGDAARAAARAAMLRRLPAVAQARGRDRRRRSAARTATFGLLARRRARSATSARSPRPTSSCS